MSNFSVLFYKDGAPNVVAAGMPGMWPHTVFQEGTMEFTLSLNDNRFLVLSQSELDMIIQGNRAKYDAYEETLFPPPEQQVLKKLEITMREARLWAPILIDKIGAYNMSRGLSREQIAQVMTILAPAMTAILGGSLYLVMEIIAQIPDSTLIPREMKVEFINYIREYLGLPYV